MHGATVDSNSSSWKVEKEEVVQIGDDHDEVRIS
jgi:hypothetical protein